ncbi:hypothetical protein AVEN_14140-1 [Araneus ventricosus]|uniref:Reverse transcriptase domain-containing protein n=1 Tax=Araneus ventricosus TaxID=182803 RepID=A0A4Y2FZ30_ARAVE|nr:hypothetical protein AVEN_14140-1 [Araneus ventricosus]
MVITKLLASIHKGNEIGNHELVLSIDIKGAFDNIQCNAIESYLDNIECNACDLIPKFRPAFSQIATSVTEHLLPPAMREFKTNRTSTVLYVFISSSSHHLVSLEMEGLVSLFNIQLRLFVSP